MVEPDKVKTSLFYLQNCAQSGMSKVASSEFDYWYF